MATATDKRASTTFPALLQDVFSGQVNENSPPQLIALSNMTSAILTGAPTPEIGARALVEHVGMLANRYTGQIQGNFCGDVTTKGTYLASVPVDIQQWVNWSPGVQNDYGQT